MTALTIPGLLPMAQRPKCRWCARPLRPFIASDAVRVSDVAGYRSVLANHRLLYYGYDAQELFCSLRHGYLFGCRAARTAAGNTAAKGES